MGVAFVDDISGWSVLWLTSQGGANFYETYNSISLQNIKYYCRRKHFSDGKGLSLDETEKEEKREFELSLENFQRTRRKLLSLTSTITASAFPLNTKRAFQ